MAVAKGFTDTGEGLRVQLKPCTEMPKNHGTSGSVEGKMFSSSKRVVWSYGEEGNFLEFPAFVREGFTRRGR